MALGLSHLRINLQLPLLGTRSIARCLRRFLLRVVPDQGTRESIVAVIAAGKERFELLEVCRTIRIEHFRDRLLDALESRDRDWHLQFPL